MRNISDTSGSFGYDETPGENGNFTTDFERKKFYQELINKANSVPIINIFKYYGLHLNEMNKKITCPFKSHKNGRESTASFYFYPQTNTYYCFGCKIGSRPCDFISEMENCSKVRAAYKILDIFINDINEYPIGEKDNFDEKLHLILDFSNTIRNFREKYNDETSLIFIENICETYDILNCKFKNLNNDALSSIISQLKREIDNFKY